MFKKSTPTLIAFALFASLCTGAAVPAAAADAPAAQVSVNLNTAAQAELESLPGIGPSKAAAIVNYRTRRPFKKVEDLMRVKGIGRKTFLKLRPYLTVSKGGSSVQKSK